MIPIDNLISLDLETGGDAPLYGLQPWRLLQDHACIKSYALAWQDGTGAVQHAGKLYPDRQKLGAVLKLIRERGRYCVVWNGVFDIAWLCADGHFPDAWHINWIDGMLLWRHLSVGPEYDENRSQRKSYSLESAIDHFFPGEAGFKEFEDFDTNTVDGLRGLMERNLGDAKYTLLITNKLLASLPPRRLRTAMIEASCLPMVGRANCFGMDVDEQYTYQLLHKLDAEAELLLQQLSPHGVTAEVVRSPKQLERVLFDDWGLPSTKLTDSGGRSTDKGVLYDLANIDPRAKLVKEYRETLNNRSKFAEAILKAMAYNSERRIHPTARVFGTYTGRMTYNSKVGKNSQEKTISSALHQTKRGEVYRAPLVAPPGYTVVEFDARAQEYRWMAILSGDDTMLSLCQEGEDAHAYMGAAIMGIDYPHMKRVLHDEAHRDYAEFKNGRQNGKTVNLSAQYRTSPAKIRFISQVQYGVPMTEQMSKQAHGMYRRTYRRVPVYWDNAIRIAQHQGYVETLAGRQVQLDGYAWGSSYNWMLESTALNYPIQGTGADQKYLALMCIKPLMVKHSAIFWFEMHDGVYFLVPDKAVNSFCAEGVALLAALPYKQAWGFTPPIAMPWDCKTGPSWGGLKEWKS